MCPQVFDSWFLSPVGNSAGMPASSGSVKRKQSRKRPKRALGFVIAKLKKSVDRTSLTSLLLTKEQLQKQATAWKEYELSLVAENKAEHCPTWRDFLVARRFGNDLSLAIEKSLEEDGLGDFLEETKFTFDDDELFGSNSSEDESPDPTKLSVFSEPPDYEQQTLLQRHNVPHQDAAVASLTKRMKLTSMLPGDMQGASSEQSLREELTQLTEPVVRKVDNSTPRARKKTKGIRSFGRLKRNRNRDASSDH